MAPLSAAARSCITAGAWWNFPDQISLENCKIHARHCKHEEVEPPAFGARPGRPHVPRQSPSGGLCAHCEPLAPRLLLGFADCVGLRGPIRVWPSRLSVLQPTCAAAHSLGSRLLLGENTPWWPVAHTLCAILSGAWVSGIMRNSETGEIADTAALHSNVANLISRAAASAHDPPSPATLEDDQVRNPNSLRCLYHEFAWRCGWLTQLCCCVVVRGGLGNVCRRWWNTCHACHPPQHTARRSSTGCGKMGLHMSHPRESQSPPFPHQQSPWSALGVGACPLHLLFARPSLVCSSFAFLSFPVSLEQYCSNRRTSI
mgnify:CR=1 FL=1